MKKIDYKKSSKDRRDCSNVSRAITVGGGASIRHAYKLTCVAGSILPACLPFDRLVEKKSKTSEIKFKM